MYIDHEVNIYIVVTDIDRTYISLFHLIYDEVAEMLSVWMDPSGNNNKLIEVLKYAAVKLGGKGHQGNSSREET